MNYLLNNLRKKTIKLLGGYVITGDEALTQIVKDKFNTISAEDILKETKDKQWMFEGQKIPTEVINVLQGQADAILRMKVWEMIKKDSQYISNKRMFLDSQTYEHMVTGKLLIYLFGVIESRLKLIAQGKSNIEKI